MNGRLLFPVRPKMHSLEHLIFDFLPKRGNPRYYGCMLDEDMIRRVKSILTGVHPCVFSLRALDRYNICVCLRWLVGT